MDVSILFNPGIYKIICTKNNKIYIGQSSNILSRFGRHVDNLENNRHDCIELQNDFNKFGKQFFIFEALEFNIKYNNEIFRQEEEILLIKKIPKKNSYNKLYINKSFAARVIKVNKKIYYSLHEAAKELNESRTHLTRKCLDKKNLNYNFVEQKSNLKFKFNKPVRCKINGTIYKSLNEAAKELNVNHSTIKHRILSKKFPDYKYFD